MPVARPAEQFWQRGSPLFYWDSMQIVVVRIVLPRCSSKAAQRGYWRAANRGDLRVLPDRCQLRRRRAPMRQNGPPGTAKGLRAKPRQPRPQALKRAASCTTTDLSPCGCSLGSNSEWQTNFCIARQVPHLGVLLTGRLSLRRHPNALRRTPQSRVQLFSLGSFLVAFADSTLGGPRRGFTLLYFTFLLIWL